MKIRIGYLDDTLGTVESTPMGFHYDGPGRLELYDMVTQMQQDGPETGDAFLQELLGTLKGYWWAQDVSEDQSDQSPYA